MARAWRRFLFSETRADRLLWRSIYLSLMIWAAFLVAGCSPPPGGSGMAGMVNIGTVHVEQRQAVPPVTATPAAPDCPGCKPGDPAKPDTPARPGVHPYPCAPCEEPLPPK